VLERQGELFPLDAGDLKAGLRFKHAVIDEVAIGNRLLEWEVERWHTIFAAKQLKRVVVDEIRWSRGQADLQRIETVKNGPVAMINGPVAFIRDDEIVVARGELLIGLHHTWIGGHMNPCGVRDLSPFDAADIFIGQIGFELACRLAYQFAPICQK
jgi:hypothetical protein